MKTAIVKEAKTLMEEYRKEYPDGTIPEVHISVGNGRWSLFVKKGVASLVLPKIVTFDALSGALENAGFRVISSNQEEPDERYFGSFGTGEVLNPAKRPAETNGQLFLL